MSLTLGRAAAVLSVVLTTVLLGPTTAAPTATATAGTAADAATRPHPGVAYAINRTIFPPGGGRVRVPVPASHARFVVLLGRSVSGWVVADYYGAATRVLVFRPGHRARVLTRGYEESPGTLNFFLSDDGRRVVQVQYDQAGAQVRVLGVRGRTLFNRYLGGGAVADFTGRKIIVGDRGVLFDVDSGTSTPLRRYVDTADIRHGVLFTASYDANGVETVSRARLGAPTEPVWSVRRLRADAVSANGRLMAGTTVSGPPRLQIRRVDDGRRLAAVRLPGRDPRALRWADARHVVVRVFNGRGARATKALFRCDLAGRCVRTTPWLSYRRLITVEHDLSFLDYELYGDFQYD